MKHEMREPKSIQLYKSKQGSFKNGIMNIIKYYVDLKVYEEQVNLIWCQMTLETLLRMTLADWYDQKLNYEGLRSEFEDQEGVSDIESRKQWRKWK